MRLIIVIVFIGLSGGSEAGVISWHRLQAFNTQHASLEHHPRKLNANHFIEYLHLLYQRSFHDSILQGKIEAKLYKGYPPI